MAMKCAWCGSLETAALLRTYECFTCGKETAFDGGRGSKVDPLTRKPR